MQFLDIHAVLGRGLDARADGPHLHVLNHGDQSGQDVAAIGSNRKGGLEDDAGKVVARLAIGDQQHIHLAARQDEAAARRRHGWGLNRNGAHALGDERAQATTSPLGGQLLLQNRLAFQEGGVHGAVDDVFDLVGCALGRLQVLFGLDLGGR